MIKRLYRVLGVSVFRNALMFFFWGKEKNRKRYFNGTRMGIENFVYQTKQSEFVHLAALIAIGLLSVILLYHQYHLMALLTNGIIFIGNFYPIILQRHHRMRLGTLN